MAPSPTVLRSPRPPTPDLLLRHLRAAADDLARRAVALDHDGAFPAEDVRELAAMGALSAPLPAAFGGLGLGTTPEGALPLMQVLHLIGSASLPLGRIYEGHVNALNLVVRHGTPAQVASAAADAQAGRLFGVWNTEGADGLRLVRDGEAVTLEGGKTFASGAGWVDRPLVTAQVAEGARVMVLARLDLPADSDRADLSSWQAHGMRASATGSFDFTGLAVAPADVIGVPDAYHRQPEFSAGAWRFAAVQSGGIARLLDEARRHLVRTGRADDPHQRLRVGQAAVAAETALLFVRRAAELAEDAAGHPADADPAAVMAYVGLARTAVERAGLDVLELVHRSVGLAGFLAPHPLEKLSRDLSTYLRQPAPDRALTEAAGFVLSRDTAFGDLWS